MLETILKEIRDELKRSNDLKEQAMSHEPTAPAEVITDQAPAEEKAKPAKKAAAKKEESTPAPAEPAAEPAPAEEVNNKEYFENIKTLIKSGGVPVKRAVKAKLDDLGLAKVTEATPEQFKEIYEFIKEQANA
ncbi:hypothetical protein KJB68_10430 [Mammaliicoccus sciuri]|uniref:hypothetical protein n=1 Tax=Mammaliicoccus sciuri TaxID=1296 RepID=UPI001F1E9B19|nr:hypothetical protein [Mammaliicoccus sciuri]MCE5058557.1 hypothetical protein [Mammaliicoccus sciuri]